VILIVNDIDSDWFK